MTKKLKHITGKHKTTGKNADMFFYSVKQAKFFNPDFEEFEEIGVDEDEYKNRKQNSKM